MIIYQLKDMSMFPSPCSFRALLAGAVTLCCLMLLPTISFAVDIQKVKTKSELEFWLVNDETVPLVTMSFSFKGGSLLDPAGKEGLAELLSTTIDEGAGEYESQAFQQRLSELAIRMSFSSGKERFEGTLRTLSSNVEDAFDLLAIAIGETRFDDEPVERMKTQLITGLRGDINDADRIASDTWRTTAYAAHPYGRPGEGKLETMPLLQPEDLRALKNKIFTRDDLKISIVGDIDVQVASRLVDHVFAKLPETGPDMGVVAPSPIPGGTVLVSHEVPQTIIRIGGNSIKIDDPDFLVAFVVNHILGGGTFTSRLYDEVREKRGLVYSIYSYLAGYEESGFFMVGAGTRGKRAHEVQLIVREELERMATEGPTAEELRAAKDYLKGSYALRFDNSGKIAQQLVGLQVRGRDINYINTRNERIEAVTIDDAKRVASRIWANPLLTVMVGKVGSAAEN